MCTFLDVRNFQHNQRNPEPKGWEWLGDFFFFPERKCHSHKDIEWKSRKGQRFLTLSLNGSCLACWTWRKGQPLLSPEVRCHSTAVTVNTDFVQRCTQTGDVWGLSFKARHISHIWGQELLLSRLSGPLTVTEAFPPLDHSRIPWRAWFWSHGLGAPLLPILAAGWRKEAPWVCPLRAKVHLIRRGRGLHIKALVYTLWALTVVYGDQKTCWPPPGIALHLPGVKSQLADRKHLQNLIFLYFLYK